MSNSTSSSERTPLNQKGGTEVPAIVGLIGHPIGHSISPVFQQAAFDALGLPYRYEAWDTSPDQLVAVVASLHHPPRAGANVTVPHKEGVPSLLDDLSDEARALGAVNTIVREGTRLVGHNTDISGFSDALRCDGQFEVRGARACVLGAGGAARAVVYALLRDGAEHIVIHNRTPSRARSLAAALDPHEARVVAAEGNAGQAAAGCDLIVNCTSVGMAGGARAGESGLSEEDIPPEAFVCDIVANPATTPLLRVAAVRGCRTLGGLAMLVRQGAAAFTLWTGHDAPLDIMFAAARRAMN
jgi:shikimate dehydrogenase